MIYQGQVYELVLKKEEGIPLLTYPLHVVGRIPYNMDDGERKSGCFEHSRASQRNSGSIESRC